MQPYVVAGKYEVVRLLGRGGMGAVYEARNLSTLKRCALKILQCPEVSEHPELLKRFFREARASAVIESEHVVQVYDSGLDDATGYAYIVMELLHGQPLDQLLKRTGPLDPRVAVKIAWQISSGLAKAHALGVCHRDVKPANLFLCEREQGELIVKILDFGIAKVKAETFGEAVSHGLTRTGSILGTPLYMSPEQSRGASGIDARSDVWSIGLVLFEMLCGRTPFAELTSLGDLMVAVLTWPLPLLQDLAPWVPPEIAGVTHRAVSRDIEKRYRDAGELRDALAELVPPGERLDADELVSLHTEQRRVVAPRLEIDDPSLLRVTARSAESVRTLSRSRSVVVWSVAAALAGAAVIGVASKSMFEQRPPPPRRELPPRVVTNVVRVVDEEANKPRRFLLKVPPEVSVTVDGREADVSGGMVPIEGSIGSTHEVSLRRGGQVLSRTVAVTNQGLLPAELQLPARAPVLGSSRRAQVIPPEAPRPSAAPASVPPPSRERAPASSAHPIATELVDNTGEFN